MATHRSVTVIIITCPPFFSKINITLFLLGEVAEQMNDLDFALTAYEHALRHNPRCVPALSQVAGIARIKENYPKVGRSPSYLCCHSSSFSPDPPLRYPGAT